MTKDLPGQPQSEKWFRLLQGDYVQLILSKSNSTGRKKKLVCKSRKNVALLLKQCEKTHQVGKIRWFFSWRKFDVFYSCSVQRKSERSYYIYCLLDKIAYSPQLSEIEKMAILGAIEETSNSLNHENIY